jgi:hypothetical protein
VNPDAMLVSAMSRSIICVASLFPLHLADAQDFPSLNLPLFSEEVSYRQNVCDRHDSYYNGAFELRDALEGFELHPLITIGQYFHLDKNGAIDEEDPGLLVAILDELAKRGSFTWRNSFAVTEGPGENHTWTDLLAWGTESYDVSVDWYIKNVERLRIGTGFPEGFVDASFILVGFKEDESNNSDLWTWTLPFNRDLWIAIAITVVVSGILYEVVEVMGPATETKPREWHPGKGIFGALLIVMQHFHINPRTRGGKLLSLSLAFWSLIVVTTYTANLASFFVIQNAPSSQIQTVDDAINAEMSMCLWKDTASHEFLLENFPKGTYVPISGQFGIFEGLLDGTCGLVVATLDQWEQAEIDKTINKHCNLERIGRVINFQDAGFGVKADSGRLCTSFVEDVLNFHLVDMNTDGTMDLLKKKEKQKTSSINCEAIDASSGDGEVSTQLSLQVMAGPFVVHAIMTGLALVWTTVSVFVGRFKQKDPERKSEDHSKRVLVMNADDDEDSTSEEASSHLSMQALARGFRGLQKVQKEIAKKQHTIADEQSAHVASTTAQLAYITAVLKSMQEKEESQNPNHPSSQFFLN